MNIKQLQDLQLLDVSVTYGPWKSDGKHIYSSVDQTLAAITGKRGDDPYVSKYKREANARLMALAPELLKMVIELEHYVRVVEALNRDLYDRMGRYRMTPEEERMWEERLGQYNGRERQQVEL